jgi:hypothetical protein
MKGPRMKLALMLGAMFLLGAISGVALVIFFHPPFFPPPKRGEIQVHMMNFLTHRLQLTADQQEKIKPMAADFAIQVEALHAQSMKQFAQLASTNDSRIAEVLTPQQKAELDQLTKQRDEDFQKHGGPPGP